VQILTRTKATLIWATTRVILRHEAGRFMGDEVKYNRVAAEVMRRNHIRTDDLYSLTRQFPASSFRAPGDVHYTNTGFEREAEQVVSAVSSALRENHSKAETPRHSDANQLVYQPPVSFPNANGRNLLYPLKRHAFLARMNLASATVEYWYEDWKGEALLIMTYGCWPLVGSGITPRKGESR
jgi:hypothetical protein